VFISVHPWLKKGRPGFIRSGFVGCSGEHGVSRPALFRRSGGGFLGGGLGAFGFLRQSDRLRLIAVIAELRGRTGGSDPARRLNLPKTGIFIKNGRFQGKMASLPPI